LIGGPSYYLCHFDPAPEGGFGGAVAGMGRPPSPLHDDLGEPKIRERGRDRVNRERETGVRPGIGDSGGWRQGSPLAKREKEREIE